MTQQVTQEDVYESLKSVFDPEIPVNVVDLGLIYDVQVTEGDVYVQMTLTFPGCGMGPYIAQQAEWAIQEIEGVEEVNIEMVFEPAWSPDLGYRRAMHRQILRPLASAQLLRSPTPSPVKTGLPSSPRKVSTLPV